MTESYRKWATVPTTGAPFLSIVIPTHNEEWRILPTIGAIASYVSEMGFDWELIISDDGSTDATAELVRARDLANVRILEVEQNTGKGGAVRRGVLQAKGQVILFCDADHATPIEQLPRLLSAIEAGADVAIGSRAASGASVQNKSLKRSILSKGLKLLSQAVFRLGVSDTQCGFKLFTGRAGRQLFSVQKVDGFAFDLELLYIARRSGMTIAEVPVEWFDAPGSTVDSSRDSVRFLRAMPTILGNGMAGRYELPDMPPTERVAPGTRMAEKLRDAQATGPDAEPAPEPRVKRATLPAGRAEAPSQPPSQKIGVKK